MKASDKRRILCYGDSNTFGTKPLWHASPILYHRYDEDARWTSVMASILGKEYHVIEEGQPGRTTIYDDGTEPFRKFCNGLQPFASTIMSHPPLDLIILMLGTNDLHSLTPPSEETLGVGISKLLDVIASLPQAGWDNICPSVLIIAPPRIKKALGRKEVYPKFHGLEGERLSKLFAPVYRKIAEERGCSFLDSSLYAEPSDADGVHLTEAGHRALGQAVAEKVKAILQRSRH